MIAVTLYTAASFATLINIVILLSAGAVIVAWHAGAAVRRIVLAAVFALILASHAATVTAMTVRTDLPPIANVVLVADTGTTVKPTVVVPCPCSTVEPGSYWWYLWFCWMPSGC